MPFYPTLREDTMMSLELITKSIESDPNYLSHADCPYSDRVKGFFTKRMIGNPADAENIFTTGEGELDVIDVQIQKVLSSLDAMGVTMQVAEVNERIAYFKARAALLEKLISLRERVFNLKEVNEFRTVVVRFLDEVCSKDQITTFMKRLDGVLGTGDDQ